MDYEIAELKRKFAKLNRKMEEMENDLREANIILKTIAPDKTYRAFDMTGCEIPEDGERFRCGWDTGKLAGIHVDRMNGTIWGIMELDPICVEREEE